MRVSYCYYSQVYTFHRYLLLSNQLLSNQSDRSRKNTDFSRANLRKLPTLWTRKRPGSSQSAVSNQEKKIKPEGDETTARREVLDTRYLQIFMAPIFLAGARLARSSSELGWGRRDCPNTCVLASKSKTTKTLKFKNVHRQTIPFHSLVFEREVKTPFHPYLYNTISLGANHLLLIHPDFSCTDQRSIPSFMLPKYHLTTTYFS